MVGKSKKSRISFSWYKVGNFSLLGFLSRKLYCPQIPGWPKCSFSVCNYCSAPVIVKDYRSTIFFAWGYQYAPVSVCKPLIGSCFRPQLTNQLFSTISFCQRVRLLFSSHWSTSISPLHMLPLPSFSSHSWSPLSINLWFSPTIRFRYCLGLPFGFILFLLLGSPICSWLSVTNFCSLC